jgi:hypothetical protein
MSKTEDLDATISALQQWLAAAQDHKERLQITDRLIRALSLKYKVTDEGKGTKFGAPAQPGGHLNA